MKITLPFVLAAPFFFAAAAAMICYASPAFVFRRAVEVSDDDLRKHIADRLAKYKAPRVIAFHDALPREDSGKIFKRRLRDPYWAGRGRMI